MANDVEVIHFGNFLRWQEDKHGGPAEFARRHGLNYSSIARYNRTADPAELNMRPYNADTLAKAFGFNDWTALDAAWRSTPLKPYPLKKTSPQAKQDVIALVLKVYDLPREKREIFDEALALMDARNSPKGSEAWEELANRTQSAFPPMRIPANLSELIQKNAAYQMTAKATGKRRHKGSDPNQPH